ncbi:hypothetical protein GCM10010331_24520 [Streptomyces xanthochromogenes]|uniref:hypothetical protein n=1 Tax=Streptomyces xanthochromogenes TaxID=67384 RepID=UPI00167198F0|nr:hypothetical protein [Streptomyces xanthochromogenes]GHB36196.1 hypothetical protein GCM10010331_24520 [Streptomyces xanthochromogenes]
MRPRLLPDTHLLPSDRGVVISGPRHTAAYALPGMHPWLERLRPFLDGHHTLDQLTADLPPGAAQHVRTLVELLAREGFVRDATADLPHTLSPDIRTRHAAIIDFIAAHTDSPEHRFQRYRDCAPVVVGSGHLANALVLALLASGVAQVRLRLNESAEHSGTPTDVARLDECVRLLQEEGGSFRYERLGKGDNGCALPADVGAVLLGSDVFDPEATELARTLALRGGLLYGQAVGREEHIVISDVASVECATSAPTRLEAATVGVARHTTGGTRPAPARRPSPYLGGPVAALAAHQLCLHLLRRVTGIDHADGAAEPSPETAAAVLDLATGRFLGAESK